MNLFEAGVVPGVVIGGIIGGMICKSYGVLAAIGGVVAGIIGGGAVGFGYAVIVIVLMAVIGGVWMAARGRGKAGFTERQHRRMSEVARPGVILGMIVGGLLCMNWVDALISMGVMAVVMATAAVVVMQLGIGRKVES